MSDSQPPLPQPPAQPPGLNFARILTPYFESLTKGTAAFAFVAYLSGYIIVSIYESSFGFTELNPFKPKIVAAGLLFCFLTAVPVYAAWQIFSLNSDKDTRFVQKFASFSINTLFYFYTTSLFMIVGLFAIASERPGGDFPLAPFIAPIWAVGIVVFMSILVVTGYYTRAGKIKTTLFFLTTGFAALLLLATLIFLSWSRHKSNYAFTIQLWLFVIGIFSIVELGGTQKSERRRDKNWTIFAIRVIVVVLAFSRYVYPKIKASWGGGEQVPIVLYFTKDSPLKPGDCLPVQLLDESENGYYFLQAGSNKATFLPRALVSMVSFSDKPLQLK